MKKIIYLFLSVLLISSISCAQPPSTTEIVTESEPETKEPETPSEETTFVDPLLEDYLSDLDSAEIPIREFGEDASYLLMEEDLVARILYPESEIASLTAALDAWIEETISYYQEEAAGSFSESGESSELTVEYDSFVVNETFAGIRFKGVFMRPYMAHPIDLVKTFNVNLETGEVLALKDLLLNGGYDTLYSRIATEADIIQEWADNHLLDHWLLTSEGLEITLARGDYLPMSDGTRTFLYSYEELSEIFAFPESQTTQTEHAEELIETDVTKTSAQMTVDPSKPMVALTFDDGPSKHTNRLLDAFAVHGGKGTFFVVGNILDAQADTLKRTSDEGHEIGGHSWNHRQLTKLDDTELENQLMNTRAKIFEITGTDTTILRPPYGSCNDTVKAKCAELGIVIVNWSLDTLDWKNKNADAIYNCIMNEVQDGAIILCHDLHGTTVDAMERVIPDLIAQGYQLVTVSELLANSEKPVQAGTVYYKQ